MRSITVEELQERLAEVLAQVRDGETFAIVLDDEVVAGLLPVERMRLQADRLDSAGEADTPPPSQARSSEPKSPSSDEVALERLREDYEGTRD